MTGEHKKNAWFVWGDPNPVPVTFVSEAGFRGLIQWGPSILHEERAFEIYRSGAVRIGDTICYTEKIEQPKKEKQTTVVFSLGGEVNWGWQTNVV